MLILTFILICGILFIGGAAIIRKVCCPCVMCGDRRLLWRLLCDGKITKVEGDIS